MNKPLPQSRFGQQYKDNYEKIFMKSDEPASDKIVYETAKARLSIDEYDSPVVEGDDFLAQALNQCIKEFFTFYELPVESCPYDEGEYIYIYGSAETSEAVYTLPSAKFLNDGILTALTEVLEQIAEFNDWSIISQDEPDNDEKELPLWNTTCTTL